MIRWPPSGSAARSWCGCLTSLHPFFVPVGPLVSADYVGAACHLVEEVLDTEACLFLQGACGDLDPVRGTTDFADVRRYGQMLGGQLLHLLARLDAPDWPPLAPGLAVHSRIVTLPGYQYPPEEPYAADVDRLTTALAEAGETERPGIAAALQVARDRLAMVRRGSVPVPAEVQALRLGDTVAVVSVPGELFCRLGLEIKRRSPAPITLVSGYTNGYEGYFPTAAAFSEGGYEPSVGPLVSRWPHGRRTPRRDRGLAAAGAVGKHQVIGDRWQVQVSGVGWQGYPF